MSITKTQADIILGMARNIMHDYHIYMRTAETISPQSNIAMNTLANNLDFSQRRLKAYLQGMLESDEIKKG